MNSSIKYEWLERGSIPLHTSNIIIMEHNIQSELDKAREANLNKQIKDAYEELNNICLEKYGLYLSCLLECHEAACMTPVKSYSKS